MPLLRELEVRRRKRELQDPLRCNPVRLNRGLKTMMLDERGVYYDDMAYTPIIQVDWDFRYTN